MRNLLSQKDKKIVNNEYKLRIEIIILTAVFFTVLIASIILLPSYILSNVKYNTVSEHAEIINKSIENRKQGEFGIILNNTQQKLELLSEREDRTLLSKVIKKILDNKTAEIQIDELFYKEKQNKDGEILVLGFASRREPLLQFKKDLEREDIFLEVVLPVSNLAPDRDIKFSINITGKF